MKFRMIQSSRKIVNTLIALNSFLLVNAGQYSPITNSNNQYEYIKQPDNIMCMSVYKDTYSERDSRTAYYEELFLRPVTLPY